MKCNQCPRMCNVERSEKLGYCGANQDIKTAFIGLHKWEEPIISGETGSGAVFFSGCNLRCVFCQNYQLSHDDYGSVISKEELVENMLQLQQQGATNINLVTATHYANILPEIIINAKKQGLYIPIVYNCGGYESVESLKKLEGIVDVYLPDYKYSDMNLAQLLSSAKDYPIVALEAITEMKRQQANDVIEDGLMKKGVIIRHLLLPNCLKNSRNVLNNIIDNFGNETYVSLMSQYFPPKEFDKSLAFLNRRITKIEQNRLYDYFFSLNFINGYVQQLSSADKKYVPIWT
ncbi:MAG: radical SAM protein [Clostridia bacterium]